MTDTKLEDETRADKIRLRTDSGATAEILLQGGQLISWQPATRPVEHLFLSEKAIYEPGAAVRGGVPVVFPQFSNRGPLAKHGFARTEAWHLDGQRVLKNGSSEAVLTLSDNADTRQLWPHQFRLIYTITLSDDSLDMHLQVKNTDTRPFSFTAGLHTYFAVGEIRGARLFGLTGSNFQDDGEGPLMTERRSAVTFGGPVDRVYHLSEVPLRLSSPVQHTQITGEGFAQTVVWNPGAEGSESLKDMTADGYRNMLCVEAATLLSAIKLEAGMNWAGSQTLRVLDT